MWTPGGCPPSPCSRRGCSDGRRIRTGRCPARWPRGRSQKGPGPCDRRQHPDGLPLLPVSCCCCRCHALGQELLPHRKTGLSMCRSSKQTLLLSSPARWRQSGRRLSCWKRRRTSKFPSFQTCSCRKSQTYLTKMNCCRSKLTKHLCLSHHQHTFPCRCPSRDLSRPHQCSMSCRCSCWHCRQRYKGHLLRASYLSTSRHLLPFGQKRHFHFDNYSRTYWPLRDLLHWNMMFCRAWKVSGPHHRDEQRHRKCSDNFRLSYW